MSGHGQCNLCCKGPAILTAIPVTHMFDNFASRSKLAWTGLIGLLAARQRGFFSSSNKVGGRVIGKLEGR